MGDYNACPKLLEYDGHLMRYREPTPQEAYELGIIEGIRQAKKLHSGDTMQTIEGVGENVRMRHWVEVMDVA